LEKDTEIVSLKKALAKAKKENEKPEETQNVDMVKIKEQCDSIDELRAIFEKAKENVAPNDDENGKLLESLIQLRDHCFGVASRCCASLKNIFPLLAHLLERVHMSAGTSAQHLLGPKEN
jgi:hypothetical protein